MTEQSTCLKGHLSPILSIHPIRSGRRGMLWVPSAKGFHLRGLRRSALFCHGTCPMEHHPPPQVKLSLILLKSLKMWIFQQARESLRNSEPVRWLFYVCVLETLSHGPTNGYLRCVFIFFLLLLLHGKAVIMYRISCSIQKNSICPYKQNTKPK